MRSIQTFKIKKVIVMMSQMENIDIDNSSPTENIPGNIESLEQREELQEGENR